MFIGLYWQQYGQPAPGMQVSGLEEEFDMSGALPRLLYVKAPAADRDPRLGDLLARIQDDACRPGERRTKAHGGQRQVQPPST